MNQYTHTLAKFATAMRASSLLEDLEAAGIGAVSVAPKWTNKKMPPPKAEVKIKPADIEAAGIVLAAFNS